MNIGNDPQFCDLERITAQLNPRYQEGRRLGSQGLEPPMTLNLVTRPKQRKREDPFEKLQGHEKVEPFFIIKNYSQYYTGKGFMDRPVVETELNPDAIAFRQGYLDGIVDFMTNQGIKHPLVGVKVLTSYNGLEAFVRGLRLESRKIPRDYRSELMRDEIYLKEKEPELDRKQGYSLGFVIGIAKKHGVVLNWIESATEIPEDEVSYNAFMQGMRGEPRDIPFFEKGEKSKVMSAYKWADERAYNLGLRIWLKSQGIQGVKAEDIKHPEALRAFRAALNGKVLPEYEPPKRDRVRVEDSYDRGHIKYLDTGLYDLKYVKRQPIKLLTSKPNPAEIARQQGQLGYNLGKIVRAQRGK